MTKTRPQPYMDVDDHQAPSYDFESIEDQLTATLLADCHGSIRTGDHAQQQVSAEAALYYFNRTVLYDYFVNTQSLVSARV